MMKLLTFSRPVAQPSRRQIRRHARAFTIVELLIVTFLALIIFAVGFTAINTTVQARSESVGRVRAAESARQFFQLLQHDLATAYPEGNVSTKTQLVVPHTLTNDPVSGQALASPISTNYDLNFFSRIDTRNVTDQFVAVSYFVNNFGELCRKVQYPPPGSNSITFQHDDNYAMFENVYSVTVNYEQWDPTQMKFIMPALPVPDGVTPQTTATHLHVTLMMYDGNFRFSNDNWEFTNSGTAPPPLTMKSIAAAPGGSRCYEARFPIPSSFTQ